MKNINCPRCRKETVFDESNPFRPFCSERCQLIDLGQWAEEKYTIPTEGQGEQTTPEPLENPDDDEFSGSPRRLVDDDPQIY